MTTLTTHVLDAGGGAPAADLSVVLTGPAGTIATTSTDSDGRISWQAALEPGPYTLDFATGDWFVRTQRDTFFAHIELHIDLRGAHTHVALLLSPYSYTTYKGS